MSDTPKKLKDMRVADLKQELLKRGLQTSGVKVVLAERLKSALVEEGINVEEYTFMENTPSKEPENGASDEEAAGVGADGKTEAKAPEASSVDKAETSTEAAEDEKEQKEAAEGEQEEPGEGEAEVSEEKEAEDDSLNIMVGDEDNLFGEDEKATSNGAPSSPPRPETVPAQHPFTSRDTLSLSSRGNRPPSENSSMRVNPDETQSVASHDSHNENGKEGDDIVEVVSGKGEEAAAAAAEKPAKEAAAAAAKSSRSDADKAKTSRTVVASARNLWVSGLAETTRARDLKELFSKYGKVEGAKVNIASWLV